MYQDVFFNNFYYNDETHSAEKELPIEKIHVEFRVVLHVRVQLVTDWKSLQDIAMEIAYVYL